ncbi:MAG: hypothetical protein JNK82_26490 [Myxococcaceae bacterium]|nr:hypothetical protein [Myxococcaceae bacterium]
MAAHTSVIEGLHLVDAIVIGLEKEAMANASPPTSVAQLLQEATTNLAEAQVDLERVMSEVTDSPRADKKMISDTIRAALDRLAAARSRLGELQ